MRLRLRSLALLLLAALASPATSLAQPAGDCPPETAHPALAALGSIPAPSFRSATRVSTVSAEVQRDSLAAVLSRIRQMTTARAADPSKPKGVVILDIDYTAVMHIRRTEEALRRVAERFGIPELEDPTGLAWLPTYEKTGFERFLDGLGLRERYPEVDWDDFRRDVSNASWSSDLKRSEVVTPGLVEFLRRVKYTGGRVVFLTGRSNSQRADMLEVFRNGGIEDPILYAKTGSQSTPVWKASKIAEIEAAHGEIVAVIDDMKENREEILDVLEGRDVLSIPIAQPGFTIDMTDEELAASPLRIATFERNLSQ